MNLLLFLRPTIWIVRYDKVIKSLGNLETKEVSIFTSQNHSTVAFAWCKGVDESEDVIFHFSITYRRPPFTVPQYSQYQFFLYETIIAHREKGKTFDQIAEWFNKKGYLSVRGKKFRGAHIHSIVKKKRLKDEKLEREYPEEWSDFSLEVVDKTLVNSNPLTS